MARVLCTLDFASDRINDVAFERTDAGMVSAEISDEAANLFTQIPGYMLVEAPKPAEPVTETKLADGPDGSGDEALQQPVKPVKRRAN